MQSLCEILLHHCDLGSAQEDSVPDYHILASGHRTMLLLGGKPKGHNAALGSFVIHVRQGKRSLLCFLGGLILVIKGCSLLILITIQDLVYVIVLLVLAI
jgi:hypothetical protein